MKHGHQSNTHIYFRPLPSESLAVIKDAIERFLLVTRPHRHPMEHLDGVLIAKELLTAEGNVPTDLRGEVNTYIQAVLGARTAGLAKQVDKPAVLLWPDKSVALTEFQQYLRSTVARILYLRALDPGTAILSKPALSRLKSQTWIKWDKFDLGIVLACRCPGCGSGGDLRIQNLHVSTDYSFNCAGCGHHYFGEVDQSEMKDICGCPLCTERKTDLLAEIVQSVNASNESMINRYHGWCELLAEEVENWPSDLEMERAYKLNRDNIGKDLRAILSFKLKDAADFEHCVKEFLESHKGKFKDIVDKAIRAKMLFKRHCPEVLTAPTAMDVMVEAAQDADSSFKGPHIQGRGNAGRKVASDILSKMLSSRIAVTDLIVDASGITIQQQDKYHDRDGVRTVRLLDLANGGDGLLDCEIRCYWREESILNPYFTGAAKPAEILIEQPAKNAEPLFNSTTEGQAYLRITSENPGCIVVPNRSLKRIAKLSVLKSKLDLKEFTYAISVR